MKFTKIYKFLNNTPVLILIHFFFIQITQVNLQPQSNMFFRINHIEGLAPGNVNDIVQDSLGFIWMGTESGLCRYDGYKFITYQNKLNDSTSLSYNNVISLLLDEDGIIWVGTLGGGLNKFDIHTSKFVRYLHSNDSNSISNNAIYKIYKDSSKRIWVSTLGGGLNKFDPITEKFISYRHNNNERNSISSNIVSSIYEDSQKNIWIGTFDSGLNLFDPISEKFIQFKHDQNNKFSINHNQIMDIIEYAKDSLLIATFGGGINLFDSRNEKFFHFENSEKFLFTTKHKNIRKLLKTKKNIWIGSYNGLYLFDRAPKTILRYIYEPNNVYSINNNKIREIFVDNSQLVWIGTSIGVNKHDPNQNKFDHISYNAEDLIGKPKILNIEKINEIEWASSKTKFSHLGNKIKYYGDFNIGSRTKSNSSLNFYRDEQNVLWIGDYNGLRYYNYESQNFNFIEYFSNVKKGQDNNYIKSFYYDFDGNFFAATLGGGLTYYNRSTAIVKRFVHVEGDENSISDSRVMPIFEDSHGILWVGTYGGLNKFNRISETFTSYKHSETDFTSISNDRIYSIYETALGDLWIGTYQGLNKYIRNTDSFEQIKVEDNLANNIIYGILEDSENNLWLRTYRGISKFNPTNKTIKNYDISNGIDEIESNGIISFKDSSGKMFFGGPNEIIAFNPLEIHDNNFLPNVVFTELRIFNETIKVGNKEYLSKSLNEIDELRLSHKDKLFSIEFAALHYFNPSNNMYAYKLEGFSNKWTYTDSQNRIAQYTNLNPRVYYLHVIASNNNGLWNKVGRTLKITISPPFWETWWFRLLSIIFFSLIIFIGYRYKLNRGLEVERTRARIARNLHDEVGGTLASIQYFVDGIRNTNLEREKNRFLNLILQGSNEVQDKIRDITWSVNPNEDSLLKFFIKVNRYASDLFDSHNIKYTINFPRNVTNKKIDMEKRHNLWCICKESIINTVKHSECKNVQILFKFENDILSYSISDDGIGFITEPNKGNGIKNIMTRSDQLKAKFNIKSAINNGTKINIAFRI